MRDGLSRKRLWTLLVIFLILCLVLYNAVRLYERTKLRSVYRPEHLVRAVVTHHSFLDDHHYDFHRKQAKYLAQLKFFHRSWVEMLKTQLPNWRTDFVIIATQFTPLFQQMKCTSNRRLGSDEPSRCIVLTTYNPVQNFTYTSFNVTDNEWKHYMPYEYMDSIAMLLDPLGLLDVYQYLFRCDEDSFLTPQFGKWHSPKFITGAGAYETEFTTNRLRTISRRLGLKDQGLGSIGSTWYGDTKTIKAAANLSVTIMFYLHAYEFTPFEKSVQIAVRNWPYWHFGVVTLYAGHIAVNHVTANHTYGVVVSNSFGNQIVDAFSTSTNSVDSVVHIHCWSPHALEAGGYFDKGQFEMKAYDNRNMSSLNLSIIRDYALYMALDTKRNAMYLDPE